MKNPLSNIFVASSPLLKIGIWCPDVVGVSGLEYWKDGRSVVIVGLCLCLLSLRGVVVVALEDPVVVEIHSVHIHGHSSRGDIFSDGGSDAGRAGAGGS